MNKQTVINADYREIDNLVKTKLGFKDYSFVAVEECGNDSCHQYTVTSEIDEFDQMDLDSWADGNFVTYSNGTILNKLCADGYIEAGEYVISVCW